MRGGWRWLAAAALIVPVSARAAGVTVSPASVSLHPLATKQFHATLSGIAGSGVTWMVNGIPGGTPTLGLISPGGLYTAPADVAAAGTVEIEAEAQSVPLVNGSAAVSLAASPATGTVFHVTTTGNDGAAGTLAAPWKTIQYAVDNVPAGSTVQVHTGVYNKLVTITRSGSAAAGFITIEAAPGETATIDGAGLGIPNGENGLVTLNNASFVRVIGFELRNYTSNSASLDPVGIYVTGAGGNIELRNNHIHDIATMVPSSSGDALGIAIYGTAAPAALTGIVVDGNQLDHLTLGFSESLAVSGNVQNFQITNNTIHDNNNIGIDIAGYEGTAPAAAYDRARNGYVAGNLLYNISSAKNPAYGDDEAVGIYVDGAIDIVIERNVVHNADYGIELASEHQVNNQPAYGEAVKVRDNLLYANNLPAITIGGYASNKGGTRYCVIANNTIVGDDILPNDGSGEIQIQFHAYGNAFRNNIVQATTQGLFVNSIVATPTQPATFAYQLYNSPVGAADSAWTWLGASLTGFAAWVRAAGEGHSQYGAAGFVDAGTHDYMLSPTSAARGAGAMLPLSQIGLYDLGGNPRTAGGKIDLGAYQN
jgi:Right handed beta helix region